MNVIVAVPKLLNHVVTHDRNSVEYIVLYHVDSSLDQSLGEFGVVIWGNLLVQVLSVVPLLHHVRYHGASLHAVGGEFVDGLSHSILLCLT